MSTAGFKKRRVNTERIKDAARASLAPTGAKQKHDYKVGQVYEIALKKVRPNPANARALYSVSALEHMVASLRDKGQLSAAAGFVDVDGDVVLIDGERRRRGAEALGLATLRIEIRPAPANEQALYLASREANLERAEQSPLDDAFAWRRLLQRKVFANQVALARAVGASESEVSRTLALADLPARLAQALSETPELLNLKMLNALREFWRRSGEDETLLFILEVVKKGLSYREVEARRKAIEAGPQLRPRSERRELKFRGGTGVIRSFNKSGRVEVSLTGLRPQDADEAVALLTRFFEGQPQESTPEPAPRGLQPPASRRRKAAAASSTQPAA